MHWDVLQFSDFVFLYAPGADNAWRQRHRFELEPRRVIAITRDYAAAFLGWVFEGESHRLLRPVSYRDRAAGPTSSGYTEVELKVHIR